jgi:pyruvate dehydrogenase E1 component beta subunit
MKFEKKTLRVALNDALNEEMQRDESVIILGEDVGRHGGSRGVTRNLLNKYGPQRVIDTPISEMAISGAACGAAFSGMRPVVENYMSDIIIFMADILVTSASNLYFATGGKMKAPMVVRGADASRPDGGPHQDTMAAWFAHIPGLKVVMPATPADGKGLMKTAIRDDAPVVFFEPAQLYDLEGDVPVGEHLVPIGKADIKKQGSDVTIVGAGRGVQLALDACSRWSQKGVSIEVVDLRTLRPLDRPTIIQSVRKTGRLIAIHEGWATYGIGSEILASVAEAGVSMKAPAQRVGTHETRLPGSLLLSSVVLPNAARLDSALAAVLGFDEASSEKSPKLLSTA